MLCTSPAEAGLHIWTGTAGDRFSDAANWIGGSPAGDTEAEVLFAATTGSRAPQNDIDELSVRSLSFSTDGYVLGGKAITVTREVMATIGMSTIACDLVINSEVIFFVEANAINVFTALNLDGSIRGSGTFVKDGNNPAWMRGTTSNTYSGGSVVRQGYLFLQKRAGSTAIPGDLRIETRAEVHIELPEQISDDAEVTFGAWTEIELNGNETIRSIVALAVPEPHSHGSARVLVPAGIQAIFVRESIRAEGNIGPNLDRLHLLGPLTVNLQERASFSAELTGDASVTVRGDGLNQVHLEATTYSSPTTLENVVAYDVDLPNSPIVQRGGVFFSGKARSLRLAGVELSHATVGGGLHLSEGSSVWAFDIGSSPVVCGGPLTLNGVTLKSSDLHRYVIGSVIPVIRVGQGPVTGTFSGLPEGAVYKGYTITYRGGDGNDIELRSLAPDPQIEYAVSEAGEKTRLTFTVAFGQLRANGSLALRRDGAILAVVPLVNGTGSIDLVLPPGQHKLEAEYSGDAQLAAVKRDVFVTVNAPTPTITSIEPSVIKTGSGRVTVTLTGSNFVADAYVYLSPYFAQSVELVSANQIRFVVQSVRKGDKGFTADVQIEQRPGNKRSNVVKLAFEDGPPEDPKRLTVTANSITASVSPGATVAMLMTGYQPFQSSNTVLTDSDNDGRVTWQFSRNLPPYFVCAVADLATGQYFVEWPKLDRDVYDLPATFHRGRTGAYSIMELDSISRGTMLWVRAGAGAWFNDFRSNPADVREWVELFDLTRVQPRGTSPQAVGVERGDLFLMLDEADATAYASTVDDSRLAPDVPGELALGSGGFVPEEDGLAQITIFRTGGSAGVVSARVSTVDDTAKHGLDYVPLDQRVTLEAGQMWKTVDIALLDDAVYGGSRRFDVRLTEPVDITIAEPQTGVSIGEAEERPVISADSVTVAEGYGPSHVATTLHLTGATRLNTAVTWHVRNGVVNGKVIFARGETSKTIDIPFEGNDSADANRTETIDLSSEQARSSPTPGTLTIVDDDVAHIFIRDASTPEGGSTRKVELTLDLDRIATKTVRVAWSTRDLSATAGSDYTAASGVATFSTFYDTTAKIEIPILGDAIAEGAETFEVVLSSPEGAELERSVAHVTIADDDATPVISIADAVAVEGRGVDMLVYLSSPAREPVTFEVSTTPGTASDSDFQPWSNIKQTIDAGRTWTWVYMSSAADSLAENDETYSIVLSNPVNATLGRSTATFTILERPKPPVILSVSDARVVEGDAGDTSVSVTLSLSERPSEPVRVTWSTVDGSATAGSDYVPGSGELTFTSQAVVTIPIQGDAQIEPEEVFTIQLSNPSGATLARSAGVVTITDDDATSRRRSVRQ